MRYVGNKRRLLSFINQAIKDRQIEGKIFCDLFAGTATVGNYFKRQGYKVISNDLLYCSYVQQKVKVEINEMPSFNFLAKYLGLGTSLNNNYAQLVVDYLNKLPGLDGFIYRNYALGGTHDQEIVRLYYTDENAKKIDVIRETIEAWKKLRLISDDEFYVLLYALLDEASIHANTTATMNSFLKKWIPNALNPIYLKLPEITSSVYRHQAYCQDGINLLEELTVVDVLYLDPPYTRTQYAASYHLLETITRWDSPSIQGITGRRNLASLKSALSSKKDAVTALEKILASHAYRHLLMSYSSDSLIPHETLMGLFQKYGEVEVSHRSLRRYNLMALTDARYNPRKQVEERLYYLKPSYMRHVDFAGRQVIRSAPLSNLITSLN